MSLASSDQQLSWPTLASLEGQRCGALGGGGAAMGLPSSLHLNTSIVSSTDSSSQLFPFFHQGESSPWGDRGFDCQRSSRAGSSISGVLQPSLCSSEGFGVVEVCDRLVIPHRVGSVDSVSDEVQPIRPKIRRGSIG